VPPVAAHRQIASPEQRIRVEVRHEGVVMELRGALEDPVGAGQHHGVPPGFAGRDDDEAQHHRSGGEESERDGHETDDPSPFHESSLPEPRLSFSRVSDQTARMLRPDATLALLEYVSIGNSMLLGIIRALPGADTCEHHRDVVNAAAGDRFHCRVLRLS
jgi:hypothetical protein